MEKRARTEPRRPVSLLGISGNMEESQEYGISERER